MSKQQITYEGLTPEQQKSLNLIQSVGIYELRALARVFGEPSPTTLRRNEQIRYIMDVIISGKDLNPIPLRQGRPYKELSNIEGILEELSEITGKDYTLKKNQEKPTKIFGKAFTFRQAEQNTIAKKLFPIKVKGIVLSSPDKNLYLFNENGSTPVLIKNFDKVKEFDYITGNAVVMNNEQEYILDEVETVNFVKYDEYSPKDAKFTPTLPTTNLKIGKAEVKLGSRYVLNQSKLTESALKTLVSTLKKNKVITLALVSNVMYEDSVALSSMGFDNTFILRYDDEPKSYDDKVNIFIEHAKRLQSIGCSLAIFVQDVVTIAHTLDANYKNSAKTYFNHTEESANIVKNLVMLAKCNVENSTTLFVTNEDSDNFDPLYTTCISKVSSKIFL